MRLRKETEQLEDTDLLFIATVADALAHPVRLKLFQHIMRANRKGEKICNKDLVATFDYAQATISQHMNKLVQSGLIEIKKETRFSYYYVHLGLLIKYVDLTKKFSVL